MSSSANLVGIDRSVPYHRVLMVRPNATNLPSIDLPDGYRYVLFQEGFDQIWAELQYAADHVETIEYGLQRFRNDYLTDPALTGKRAEHYATETDITKLPLYDEMRRRVLFVLDSADNVVGTGALWLGDMFGPLRARLHWIAVHPNTRGRGLARALCARLLKLYHELDSSGLIYLTTQTWSYPAINIYRQLGFEPYLGPRPVNWGAEDADEAGTFEEQAAEAWRIIDEKIAAYRRAKGSR